jgi:hypothetical protein
MFSKIVSVFHFPSGLLINILACSPLLVIRATYPAHLILVDFLILHVFSEE